MILQLGVECRDDDRGYKDIDGGDGNHIDLDIVFYIVHVGAIFSIFSSSNSFRNKLDIPSSGLEGQQSCDRYSSHLYQASSSISERRMRSSSHHRTMRLQSKISGSRIIKPKPKGSSAVH
jgi:hypothetical protein